MLSARSLRLHRCATYQFVIGTAFLFICMMRLLGQPAASETLSKTDNLPILDVRIVEPLLFVPSDRRAGAVSDRAPLELFDGERQILIYDSARNSLLEAQGRPDEMVYFYDMQLEFEKDSSGLPKVFGPYEINEERSVVSFTLRLDPPPMGRLIRQISQDRNDNVRRANIVPIVMYDLSMSVFGVDVVDNRSLDNPARSLLYPVDVELEVETSSAERLVKRIREGGVVVDLSYKRLVQNRTINYVSVNWSEIRKTNVFRTYFGPAGPRYITAAQAATITAEILEEQEIFIWSEGPSKQFSTLFNQIVAKLAQPNRIPVPIQDLADPKKFLVDPNKFIDMRDKITRVATSSRSLDHREWCRRYKKQTTSMSRDAYKTRKNKRNVFNILIPIKKIKFGLNFDFSSDRSQDELKERYYDYLSENQDCGKKIIENEHEYEWNGEKFIPKSIYLHQKFDADIVSGYNGAISRIGIRFNMQDWNYTIRSR